jgi:ornithine carbamoyltransferase
VRFSVINLRIKRDLLWLIDVTPEEMWDLIITTHKIKSGALDVSRDLLGKTLAMIFQKPSTRTRVSFEVAMLQMGGHAIYLDWHSLQLGRGESIKDTARVLSRYVDGIMARVYSQKDLEELAINSDVPVINGLSDLCHPVQILSDLYTIYEKFGRLYGIKVAYVGDGNNVANSLLVGAAKIGLNISLATPSEYKPDKFYIDKAYEFADVSGSKIEFYEDPIKAVKDADIIYTDTFVSMGMEEERRKRLNIFLPKYQVNMGLIKETGKRTFFMHCLPAHRGEEVVDEVIDSGISLVYVQAENRLHMQKAILRWLMKDQM